MPLEKALTKDTNDAPLPQEQRIIEKSKTDPSAFKTLYETYFTQIFKFVYNKVGDKDTTADIVSQVFLKALLNIKTYKHQGFPFSAWLYRIASNEVMQYFRHTSKLRIVNIDEQMLEVICEDARGPDIEELKSYLEQAIQQLDHNDLHILELRYFENKSYKEIAYILDVSETSVKTKAWRILEKIRRKKNEIHE